MSKIYKYKCDGILLVEAQAEWELLKQMANRYGYRMEIDHIKNSIFGGNPVIYYVYVSEN